MEQKHSEQFYNLVHEKLYILLKHGSRGSYLYAYFFLFFNENIMRAGPSTHLAVRFWERSRRFLAGFLSFGILPDES